MIKVRRPRRSIVLFAIVVLISLAMASAYRIYSTRRLTKAVNDYLRDAGPILPESYAPAAIKDDTENAAIWLEAGTGAVVLKWQERTAIMTHLLETPVEQWSTADTQVLRSLLTRNEGALVVLGHARDVQSASFDLNYYYSPRNGVSRGSPNLLEFMQAAKMLACKAKLETYQKNVEQALQTAAIHERMAAALEQNPLILHHLVGQVIEKYYHREIQEMLPLLSDEMLLLLLQQMDHLDQHTLPLDKVFGAEGAITYNEILAGKYPGTNEVLNVQLMQLLCRRILLSSILEVYGEYAAASRVPAAAATLRSNAWPNVLVRNFFTNNFLSVIKRSQFVDSERLAARLAVQLCLQAQKDGSYPAALTKTEQIRSALTGEYIQYALMPDGSATLSFPEANRIWDKDPPSPQKVLLVWKLPAYHH